MTSRNGYELTQISNVPKCTGHNDSLDAGPKRIALLPVQEMLRLAGTKVQQAQAAL